MEGKLDSINKDVESMKTIVGTLNPNYSWWATFGVTVGGKEEQK